MGEVEALYRQVDSLVAEVRAAGESWAAARIPKGGSEDFADSAINLGAYLALRHHDLRPLQRKLMALGLSSLGRLESRVVPTLAAVGRRWLRWRACRPASARPKRHSSPANNGFANARSRRWAVPPPPARSRCS